MIVGLTSRMRASSISARWEAQGVLLTTLKAVEIGARESADDAPGPINIYCP